MMLKNILKQFALMIVGILIGATGMAYLSQSASQMHAEVIESFYVSDEVTAAEKAIKDGNYLLAAHHFKNLSESYSDSGIEAFVTGKKSWDLMFPFKSIILRKIKKESDPENIGRLRISGIYHGMLAYSLDKSGRKQNAQAEWQISKTLLNDENISETQKLIENLIKVYSSSPAGGG